MYHKYVIIKIVCKTGGKTNEKKIIFKTISLLYDGISNGIWDDKYCKCMDCKIYKVSKVWRIK